ncbi:pyridoxamine 5'-phosphate oxidase family protein [bacterium]|nr:pyridoxamine 5'-phosphate oxidase family protein [candidate division CSSED10-310 bacterium]
MTELNQKIISVVQNNPLGVLATVTDEGKPMGRYLMFSIDETMTIFAITGFSSRKVAQLKNNPNAHVTLGYHITDSMSPWIGYSGHASILTDAQNRRKFWKDDFKRYFKDQDDPEYCIIRITPDWIEYWAGWKPEIWKP